VEINLLGRGVADTRAIVPLRFGTAKVLNFSRSRFCIIIIKFRAQFSFSLFRNSWIVSNLGQLKREHSPCRRFAIRSSIEPGIDGSRDAGLT
jgi:hypothetical protein